MIEKLFQQQWIALPKDVRTQLISVFGLQRTGVSEVRDQTVISDGFTNADLEVVSKEKMAEYTGLPLETSFMQLLEQTLAKVHLQLHPILEVPEEIKEALTIKTERITVMSGQDVKLGTSTPNQPLEVEKPKRGRKSNATKTQE